jgi:hypothetical protein
VAILHEVPGQRVWFSVPGMYGGFDITLRQGNLDVRSWCRVVGGSGQAHLITPEGAVLVDEGFVQVNSSGVQPSSKVPSQRSRRLGSRKLEPIGWRGADWHRVSDPGSSGGQLSPSPAMPS